MAKRDMGVMRHSLADRGNDLYETPPVYTQALIRTGALHGAGLIWEPCAGRGAMARVLRDAGHAVAASDLVAYDGADTGIETPIDFLMEPRAPDRCRLIVTNPPFKLANEFISHGLHLGCDVIVLLRLAALEGAGRSRLIDQHLRRVWLGKERAPAMHRDGWTGNRLTNSGAPYAWFHFSPVAWPAGSSISLTRISWRA